MTSRSIAKRAKSFLCALSIFFWAATHTSMAIALNSTQDDQHTHAQTLVSSANDPHITHKMSHFVLDESHHTKGASASQAGSVTSGDATLESSTLLGYLKGFLTPERVLTAGLAVAYWVGPLVVQYFTGDSGGVSMSDVLQSLNTFPEKLDSALKGSKLLIAFFNLSTTLVL